MKYEQESFDAGLNMLTSDIRIAENGYRWLVNGRQRLNSVEANKKNVEITNVPAGLKQAHIGVGNVHIVFVAGFAYYRVDGIESWTKIPGFSMNTTAARYWTLAVPASKFHFARKHVLESANGPIVVDSDFTVNGTPAGVIVQDNINQPQFIEQTSDGIFIARTLQTYSQWSITNPEYVPIGRQMLHKDGVVFIVARDGRSVFRSVTGRPLDFVVSVDPNGNKLPSELGGGAARTSFTFDFDEITYIGDCNAESTFVLGTARNIRLVQFDYLNTIFGEPRFHEAVSIKAGVINQESFIEVLGDFVFIDYENIKSFNAVLQLQNEGRNSIFSLQLAKLLRNIKQREGAAVTFDNFALFHVKTNYGNLIAVYDMLHEKWVALDLTVADRIKQFTVVETTTETKLYAITHNNELFQLYGSNERELVQLMTRSFTPVADAEHKSQTLKTVFRGGSQSGDVSVIEYVDELQSERLDSTLTGVSAGVLYPVRSPVIPHDQRLMVHETFTLNKGLMGKKIAFVIQWNTDAALLGFIFNTSETLRETSMAQQARTLNEAYS